MTNAEPVDKDRLLFTQCNDTILLRCPECTSTKILRQCKILHNFPALWCHIKREHPEIIEFRLKEFTEVLDSIFKAYKWNMFPKWAYSEAITTNKVPTTSSSLLFDERPISRIDVWERILEITKKLKIQSELYPIFRLKQLKAINKVVLGEVDPRTAKKYLNCVIDASAKNIRNGTIDVTAFCDTAGV